MTADYLRKEPSPDMLVPILQGKIRLVTVRKKGVYILDSSFLRCGRCDLYVQYDIKSVLLDGEYPVTFINVDV